MLIFSQDDALEEAADFILGEVVWKLAHFVQKINVFIQDKRHFGLKDGIYQEIHMGFLEDVWDLLEELVKRDPALVVSFLRDFVEFLKICDFEDRFVDQVPEELLWFLD